MSEPDELDPELFLLLKRAVVELGRPSIERLERAKPSSTFAELGFDSLGVVELSAWIEDLTKVEIMYEALLGYSSNTLTLGAYFSLLSRKTIPA